MILTFRRISGAVYALLAMATTSLSVSATVPDSYYAPCENKGGQELLESLNTVISNHSVVSYSGLWDLYKTTDVYPDGKIWDMYSTKHWNTGEKCGNYTYVGDCYNREHSMPKSWFGEMSPMVSDAFHIYPTDGKVNGQRSNYPYGECANGTTLPSRGGVEAKGRFGRSTFSGYSGTVFEPDDEYKGDLARSYFYMAACYNEHIDDWDSDMLAGNTYPAFTGWATELLLKWHRQDPVSDKEKARNEAVYARQHNRNPFIDYPEMAEYVWGDKKTELWTSSLSVDMTINRPVDGSRIDMPAAALLYPSSVVVPVKTSGATATVDITLDGASSFAVSANTLSASQANAGAEVTITCTPSNYNQQVAHLTVSCGQKKSVVTLVCMVEEGIPVGRAKEITSESFLANWTYAGGDINGNYMLDVKDSEGSIPGYPKAVPAQAGTYTVAGLEPSTSYCYGLKGNNIESNYVFFDTADLIPSIDFLFEGELYFVSEPGVPSEAAELLMSVENIEGDITVDVLPPFEISTDKDGWSTVLVVTQDQDRIYMRLNSETAGTFETPLRAKAGDYTNDAPIVSGKVSSLPDFVEDFEADGKYDTYNAQTYMGTAAVWSLKDAGIWSGDKTYEGSKALRAGKSGSGLIEMAENHENGIGTISFYACRYNKDGNASVAVETSTDGGSTWSLAGNVDIAATDYTLYSVHAGVSGSARMRLRQTGGKRFLVDNLALTPYSTGLSDPSAEHNRWDAFCRDGKLVVEVKAADGIELGVYSIKGITLTETRLPVGETIIEEAETGSIYIVSSSDHARTVLVR